MRLHRVLGEVEVLRVLHQLLHLQQRVAVELEPFQMDDQRLGRPLDVAHFVGLGALVAVVAHVSQLGVLAVGLDDLVAEVFLDQPVNGVLSRLFAVEAKQQVVHLLLGLQHVVALQTGDLLSQQPAKDVVDDQRIELSSLRRQVFLKPQHKQHKILVRVFLLPLAHHTVDII